MGNGLRRVAKACGGIKATNKEGETYHYDADGKLIKVTKQKRKK